ncbi:pyridoxamine 5'-phosphate oxidase family protein [Sporomusa sp.]|uniref:pyridoxamine 5'-phosphate oxidase family protein n=1 Tax=Sporomusa sp. TaxID=2078658 RepID=UPI002BE8C038|nr:pyridoxamine 5'-phosphate oxidase family protein [Sporomusa sp.]HWR44241.1 pyridoxamine 5'-phosphate oxidase family protein [Sporomusa sp.]
MGTSVPQPDSGTCHVPDIHTNNIFNGGVFTLFSEMRRKEKLMSPEDTIKVLKEAEFGSLACIGENGYPYSVPLNYAYENNAIYFHSAHAGNKIENIKRYNKVSFSVVNYQKLLPEKFDTEYDSAIVYGNAFEVTDEQEKRDALMFLIEKYSGNYRDQGIAYIDRAIKAVSVYKIQIIHMTGKLGR